MGNQPSKEDDDGKIMSRAAAGHAHPRNQTQKGGGQQTPRKAANEMSGSLPSRLPGADEQKSSGRPRSSTVGTPQNETSGGATPVPIPTTSKRDSESASRDDDTPSVASKDDYADEGYHPPTTAQNFNAYAPLNYPPRLPLPIETEEYVPGSPIITSQDVDQEISDLGLADQASLLSHNTTNDTDAEEDEPADTKLPKMTVPTTLEWRGSGTKVYATGTFSNWSKKHRLHSDPKDGVLRVTLHVQPGTHHLKFIVDGDMTLNNDLPTAVDYTNVLVNYIEVLPPDDKSSRQREIEDRAAELDKADAQDLVSTPSGLGLTTKEKLAQKTDDELLRCKVTDRIVAPNVPKYLDGLEQESTNPKEWQLANDVLAKLPRPPSLPGFLGKSILNGITPVKDDGSVLNMPSHTVLAHLATSPIKAEVLATSVTTRYHRKYVTLMTYRPHKQID